MSKHTPGPWELHSAAGAAPRVIAPGTHDICVMAGASSNESVMADARLIAAAPELLEFAEEVRRTGDTRLASMAIALINKATGCA